MCVKDVPAREGLPGRRERKQARTREQLAETAHSSFQKAGHYPPGQGINPVSGLRESRDPTSPIPGRG